MSWTHVKTAASGIVISVKTRREQRGSAVGAPQPLVGQAQATGESLNASRGLKQPIRLGVANLKAQGVQCDGL